MNQDSPVGSGWSFGESGSSASSLYRGWHSQGSRLVWNSLEGDCQGSAHPRTLQGCGWTVLLPQCLY